MDSISGGWHNPSLYVCIIGVRLCPSLVPDEKEWDHMEDVGKAINMIIPLVVEGSRPPRYRPRRIIIVVIYRKREWGRENGSSPTLFQCSIHVFHPRGTFYIPSPNRT